MGHSFEVRLVRGGGTRHTECYVRRRSNSSPPKRRESTGRLLLRRLLGLVLLVALGWFGWLYFQINAVAGRG